MHEYMHLQRSKILTLGIVFLAFSISIQNFAFSSPEDITPPTGIVLFIGDGMGFPQIEIARLVEYGPEGESAILELPYQGSVSTTNIDGATTDSAASATAIATGVKTRNGRISMNFDASLDLETITEIAKNNGYATGIVATCHLTHATPAAFMAHDSSRNHYIEIAEDISTSGVDVIFGGGSSSSYLGNYISQMQSIGYSYITNKTELNSSLIDPILGLFTSVSLTPMFEKNDTSPQPSLQLMTQKAIELLNNTGNPFFLMVEGSQIDWGSHDNDPVYATLETIEFEKSVRFAKELAELDNKLQVLVTADHETGGLHIGDYTFLTSLPSELDDYETQKYKRIERVNQIETSWTTGGHTISNVILAGIGPNANKILNATHHIDTFSIMRELIDGKTTPSQLNSYKGYFNLYVALFLGLLGLTAVLTGVLTWLKERKRNRK